jgi:hypothetical protein
MDALVEHCAEEWPGHQHPVSSAVDAVLDTTGEYAYVDNRGIWNAGGGSADRIAKRAGFELHRQPPAFTDRDGVEHFPFGEALRLAMAFAAAEPALVLLAVDAADDRVQREARELGSEHFARFVYEWAAAHALVRQWAGSDEPLVRRDREIERLNRLLIDAIYVLKAAGQEREAAQLDKKLRG